MVVGEVQGVYPFVPERAPCPLEDHPCSFCVGGVGGGGGGRRRGGGRKEERKGRGGVEVIIQSTSSKLCLMYV